MLLSETGFLLNVDPLNNEVELAGQLSLEATLNEIKKNNVKSVIKIE